MKEVGESLAGRASYLNLWPPTRREQLGLATAGLWSELLDTPTDSWLDLLLSQTLESEPWIELSLRGGYPVSAHDPGNAEDRTLWFDAYASTYLERDIPRLSSIDGITDMRRLMTAACLRLAARG